MALLASFVAFANSYFGWGIQQEQMWVIITPLLGFIGFEELADAIKNKK